MQDGVVVVDVGGVCCVRILNVCLSVCWREEGCRRVSFFACCYECLWELILLGEAVCYVGALRFLEFELVGVLEYS